MEKLLLTFVNSKTQVRVVMAPGVYVCGRVSGVLDGVVSIRDNSGDSISYVSCDKILELGHYLPKERRS